MRILFVTGELPYPPYTGAKLRTFNLLKNLEDEYEVTLLTMIKGKEDLEKVEVMKRCCHEVIFVWRNTKYNLLRYCFDLWFNLFSPLPFIASKHYWRPFHRKFLSLVASESYDIVHCDSISLAWVLSCCRNLPRVLNQHNIESTIWRGYFRQERNLLKKIYIGLQRRKVENYERNCCQSADLCIVVSEKDRLRLQKKYNVKNSMVVPNGVDVDYFNWTDSPLVPFSMVFTGSMDWRPNQDAILHFVYEIYPLIKKEIGNVSLWIVGQKPPSHIKRLANIDSQIKVTGFVEDVRGYIAQASLYVVPLRIGGGSRLKILEAMAMKKPVVSTIIGAEGLEVTSGSDIIITDSPQEFARECIKLLKNPQLIEKLAMNGRSLVEKTYDWKIITKSLQAAWKVAHNT